MNFSREELREAAQDARLALTQEEEKEFFKQIEAFIFKDAFFLEMQKIDVEPSFYGSSQENTLGEDVVEPSLPLEEVLKNAPDDDGSCFLVPKIVE